MTETQRLVKEMQADSIQIVIAHDTDTVEIFQYNYVTHENERIASGPPDEAVRQAYAIVQSRKASA